MLGKRKSVGFELRHVLTWEALNLRVKGLGLRGLGLWGLIMGFVIEAFVWIKVVRSSPARHPYLPCLSTAVTASAVSGWPCSLNPKP